MTHDYQDSDHCYGCGHEEHEMTHEGQENCNAYELRLLEEMRERMQELNGLLTGNDNE